MRGIISAAAAMGVAVLPTLLHAGAWTLPKGQGQIIATATPTWADSVFGSPRRQDSAKYELQVLMEYGLTDRLTAIVWPSLQHVTTGAPAATSRTGFGRTEAGARYRLADGDGWVLSGQATVRVPGSADAADTAGRATTGSEFDLRALAGYNIALGGLPGYLDAQVAYRLRGGGSPNEWRADLTLGVRPYPQWLLFAQMFNVMSDGAGSQGLPSYRYHKLQLGFVHDITARWSVSAAGVAAVAGRNALEEKGIVLGLWYRF